MEFGLKFLDEHGFVKNKMISGCFGSRFPGQSRMVQISLSLPSLYFVLVWFPIVEFDLVQGLGFGSRVLAHRSRS